MNIYEEARWESLTIAKLGKLNRFKMLWRNGRQSGYPICCIFRFSFEDALDDGKVFTPSNRRYLYEPGRGLRADKVLGFFVPCGIFHHRTHDILPSGETVIAEKTLSIMKLLRKEPMLNLIGVFTPKQMVVITGIAVTSYLAMDAVHTRVKRKLYEIDSKKSQ